MSAPPEATQVAAGEGIQGVSENENTMSDGDATPQAKDKDKDKDGKKRRFFGLGKRKESSEKTPTKSSTTTSPTTEQPTTSVTSPPLEIPRPAPRSPLQGAHQSLSAAASPARSSRYRSQSPRLHSPASSQIFERNVQESNTIPDDLSSNIPSHIQTEDHIPAVLEASSLAITDDHLGPDEVEIVMHAAHHPAAEKVQSGPGGLGTLTPGASDTGAISPIQGLSPIEDFGLNLHQSLESTQAQVANQYAAPQSLSSSAAMGGDTESSYGALDNHDPRRLSFISFADVVQSEHDAQAQTHHGTTSRDSMLHLSMSNSTANRSPSPVRSPASANASSPGGIMGEQPSPPTSGTPSTKGLDIGAATGAKSTPGVRLPPGSPTSPASGMPHSPRPGEGGGGGELVVETMRQTLRHTGSGELVPRSAVEREGDENVFR